MSVTRVLLVEDEPGYARFLREVLLDAEGEHRLTWVSTLEEAMSRLGEGSFEIVLLDLGLPDADGTEALTQVSTTSPATPIVVLSALNDLDVALESMRLGAQEYLVKGQSEELLLPRAIRYAIERKRLQDVAAVARAEAERANAVKDDFLAMLGHELRNPLAPIVTGLDQIALHEHADIARELTIVQRQVQHVVRLVDDLLDVSRIARGRMELQRVPVDLADVVADGIETSLPLFEERRHTLEVHVPRDAFFVDGDRTRLAQVVANLLTNAAKYTDKNGSVTVSAQGNGDLVELSVRDNGVGMAPELLERVFELFQQGARTIDRSVGGLGLGLAIVRNIVTLHDGVVTATSEGLGKGSTLTVRLPALPADRRPEDAARASPLPRMAEQLRRVLIVDDNADGAEMLEAGLTEMGHITRTALDGPSALEVAKAFRPDIALVDIGLPTMNGYEVARELRTLLGDDVPTLIAMTGYGQASDRARSRAAGFDRHVVKPIRLRELAKLIESVGRK